ncbi:glycosyltransferase [Streptomyces sp. WMMC1477]|uniref:glycosyltransferase n=1 Tax=Streptomyces sp. WMMC1477 TaxID=3015155 RepID=UPI0022B69A38|nr:glycosyltransferase [Streptomyces sp. WMMC1477]MCZ7433555.1 glycosyltransferase [Streptomyces sp. WMMC1477]
MHIAFLLYNAYGIGGTIRSTVNLSGALAAAGHTVEIVSVHRTRDDLRLELRPGVRTRALIECRRDAPGYDGGHPRTAEPTGMWEDSGVSSGPLAPTRLTDERVAEYLRRTEADVVIGTRPVINGYLDRYGRSRYLRIGQEHLTHDFHNPQLREDQKAAFAGLDALVTVSEADAVRYREMLPGADTRVLCIPNGVPAVPVTPSAGDSKTIVAAGRLIPVKRYDRLVRAFAKVAAQRPDWTLRLYGRGPRAASLRSLVDELGLYNRVRLMGAVTPIETEWAKGAVAAVSSDGESFGMTIVEAMHCGVPVVSTDCPLGPGEIITHGRDGLLVPLDGGEDAFAEALLQLIDDDERRRAMGRAARETARTYDPERIAARYIRLMEELGASRRGPAHRLRGALAGYRARRAAAPGGHGPGETGVPAPRARAAATADGGVAVRLAAADLPDTPLDLVLRLRRDPGERQVVLPLPPGRDATDGWLEVVLRRSEHRLPEGRWDLHTAPRGTDRRRRVRAELVEQAALVTLEPRVDENGVSAWVPYTTSEGNLSVRTWLRPAHAEVEHVEVGEEAVVVTAVAHGAVPGPDAAVLAASREDADRDFAVAARPLAGSRFTVALPYAGALARRSAGHDLWDLRLLPAPGAEPVPIGRIGGDSADRRKTDVYPAVELPHPERGTTRIRPYITFRNELALSARDIEPPGDA